MQEDREKIKALQVEVREAKEKASKAGPSAEDVSLSSFVHLRS